MKPEEPSRIPAPPDPGGPAGTSPVVEAPAGTGRDKLGRFQHGTSGNPSGRPPGIPNRNTEFVKLLNTRELRAVWKLAKQQARKGDTGLLMFLLERGLIKQSPEAAGLTVQIQQTNQQHQTHQETHVKYGAHLEDPAVRGALADVAQRLADRGGFTGGNGDARG